MRAIAMNISQIKDTVLRSFILIASLRPTYKTLAFCTASLVIYQLRRGTTVTLSRANRTPHLGSFTLCNNVINKLSDGVANRRHWN